MGNFYYNSYIVRIVILWSLLRRYHSQLVANLSTKSTKMAQAKYRGPICHFSHPCRFICSILQDLYKASQNERMNVKNCITSCKNETLRHYFMRTFMVIFMDNGVHKTKRRFSCPPCFILQDYKAFLASNIFINCSDVYQQMNDCQCANSVRTFKQTNKTASSKSKNCS